MRTLKFRAWDGKKMYDWKYLQDFPSRWLNKDSREGSFVPMQYTGVKDKNGWSIYEGDIVRVLDRDWPSQLDSHPEMNHQQYLDSISSYCEVVFAPAEFFLKQIKGCGYFSPSLTGVTHRDVFEVVGNIYENPELLIVDNEAKQMGKDMSEHLESYMDTLD